MEARQIAFFGATNSGKSTLVMHLNGRVVVDLSREFLDTNGAPKSMRAHAAAGKKPAEPQIIIQSPLGGEITPFGILARVGQVDKVHIRVDLNKAFWVRGNENGSIDLW